ncbi:hypothetical protein JOQ06_008484 [Pogonophryne albipinna]|uniref:Uncharacterized protein n=1 Tax=Pogonophryne albipinna TaxID=1090488 RepID=A0AAD6AK97_9TELE|nr:hypothetical protein JOQ06_008484 [Pogonophryne albipinna]
METAGNFGVLKEEINDLREGFGELKIRADAAELRIAENEDREIAAWAKKDIRVKDCRIFFDEDFTTQVFKERAKYRQVRKQLQERNIKSRILFPAKLKLFEKNGKVRVFNNPQDAAQGLLEYGVNMESPAGEPDLESTLQTSGWQTHRSRNRRTPGCELMSDVKTLIDSLDRHERAKE